MTLVNLRTISSIPLIPYFADKQKQARKALQWLRGKDADVSREFAEIERMNNEEGGGDDESSTGCSEVFKKMYIRPLAISIGLMFFQQMSGINAVIFYTVKIFKVCISAFYLYRTKIFLN